jgi:predicted transcriptional regulator YdeE
MKMKTIQLEYFAIIGLAIRTTNENGQSTNDIPNLWNKFLSENIIEQIPNKIDNSIYCVYTDYEKDYTKPYTTILGCKVENLAVIPEGLTGITINKGNYQVFTAKGKLTEGIVFEEWVKIWNANIPRAYSADFEVYGEKAQDPNNAEIDIFIAIK